MLQRAKKHALRNGFVSGWILVAAAFRPERMQRVKAILPPNRHFLCSEDGGRNPSPHVANLAVRSSPAGRHP